MHIHLDPLGGVAGDMFVAALADAFPAQAAGLENALGQSGLIAGVSCALVRHNDGVLSGSQFAVRRSAPQSSILHGHIHAHRRFAAIRTSIHEAPLAESVRRRAIGIFTLLAEVEGKIHGVAPDDVEFHEVGAWDSIADIVGAAWLIDAVGSSTWSVGPLPLGGGRAGTAHGALPVPAPATAALLHGFNFFDDGIGGERVTPTGAAILKHLNCAPGVGATPRKLAACGFGFGTKKLAGTSNVLRALVFEDVRGDSDSVTWTPSEVGLIGFEIDDQTGEDLAVAIDRLRAVAGVIDVIQVPAFGKKGRMLVHVQVLVEPQRLDAAIEACFCETETLGLRYQVAPRAVLQRRNVALEVAGTQVRVKLTRRPGGTSAKAENDDIRVHGGRAARKKIRKAAEHLALARDTLHEE